MGVIQYLAAIGCRLFFKQNCCRATEFVSCRISNKQRRELYSECLGSNTLAGEVLSSRSLVLAAKNCQQKIGKGYTRSNFLSPLIDLASTSACKPAPEEFIERARYPDSRNLFTSRQSHSDVRRQSSRRLSKSMVITTSNLGAREMSELISGGIGFAPGKIQKLRTIPNVAFRHWV
jgi:hypothetical protein